MAHIPAKRSLSSNGEEAPTSTPNIAAALTKKPKLTDEVNEVTQEAIDNQPPEALAAASPSRTKFIEATDKNKSSNDLHGHSDDHDKQAVDHAEDVRSENDGSEDEEHDEEYSYDESENNSEGYDSDDSKESEYEVEEHEHVIPTEPDSVFNLKLSVSKEEFEEWLDTISITCTHNGKDIGFAVGKYIQREHIRAHFWRDMDEQSQDMSTLAFEVFDHYGYLQTNLKEHPIRRGTGVWGSELDSGPLFFIEILEITSQEWRRKGLGRMMANKLIRKAQKREISEPMRKLHELFTSIVNESRGVPQDRPILNVLVIPGSLTSHVERDGKGKSKREKREIQCCAFDTAVAFWRSLGFRRIGASRCFGLSLDPNHESHSISVADDFDLPFAEHEVSDDESGDEMPLSFVERAEREQKKKLNKLKTTHPLHYATLSLSDADCVEFYKVFEPKDGAGWQQVDHSMNTVLHVAASQLKLQSIQWLMENAGAELTSAHNKNGYTPLESLQHLIDLKRTQPQDPFTTGNFSDRFSGFSSNVISCLCALSGLGTLDPSRIESLRLKYGCTCEQCIAGFISQHMKLTLVCQAEVIHDILADDIDDGRYWYEMHQHFITDVRDDIQRNFLTNKSLRQGFTNIFKYIAECLNSDLVPTRDNVLNVLRNENEWPPVTRNYLERGGTIVGKVEAALRTIFDSAKRADDKFGNGEFEQAMKAELSEFKVCRNDHEYGFVASKCGVSLGEDD